MEVFALILFFSIVVLFVIYDKKTKNIRNENGESILPLDLMERDLINFKNTNETLISAENLIKTNITKAKKNLQIKASKSHLTGCVWLLIDETKDLLYTFKDNNELIITDRISVQKGSYEIIVDNNTILITQNGNTENFELIVESQHFLFLKKFFSNDIVAFANYTKYKDLVKAEVKKQAKQEYQKLLNE